MSTATQFHEFTLDGFQLTGHDSYGCRWTVTEAPGWFTGGEVRSSIQSRMQQDGDWRGRTSRAGRVVVLRGTVHAPNGVVLEQAGRRLSAVLAHGGFGELAGDSAAGLLTSRVQVDQTPMFEPVTSKLATWQIAVGSEDPLLYGAHAFNSTTLAATGAGTGLPYPLAYPLDYGVPAGVTPGAITVPNEGTAPYHLRLQIDGPVTNPVVTMAETGDRIAYAGTVAAGQWLEIDCARRRVILRGSEEDEGVSMRHLVSFAGAWLSVPVGGGSLSWTADTADPAATLSVWAYEGAFA